MFGKNVKIVRKQKRDRRKAVRRIRIGPNRDVTASLSNDLTVHG